MALLEAEKTITTGEIDEETYEKVYKTNKRTIPFFFIRISKTRTGSSNVESSSTVTFVSLISTADKKYFQSESHFRIIAPVSNLQVLQRCFCNLRPEIGGYFGPEVILGKVIVRETVMGTIQLNTNNLKVVFQEEIQIFCILMKHKVSKK